MCSSDLYQKDADNKDESNLVEAVVNNAAIDVPDVMIEEQIDQYIEDFKYQLSYQGLNIENYFKYTETTMEKLRETYRERAEKAVRTRLVFEEIVGAEKIKASEKAVDKKIKEYAERVNQPYEAVKGQLREEDID